MIRVTVELISAIHPSRNEILGVAEISNDCITSAKTQGNLGSYKCWFSKRGKHKHLTWKECKVENFPRKKLLMWDLLFRALKIIVGERN